MNSKNANVFPKLIYVKWPSQKELKCPVCGSEIKYLYNDGGRKVITLQGIVKLYTCYYSCTNEKVNTIVLTLFFKISSSLTNILDLMYGDRSLLII
ncbi:MAG: hypothetical protein ACTSRP_19145 [Candidatus Helarchaeota archaeon]